MAAFCVDTFISLRTDRTPATERATKTVERVLCHEGTEWRGVRDDFVFDHEAETGVPLVGAHARAACLLCHNDRGPVAVFAAQGCGGCHEDIHRSTLGPDCARCHTEETWRPFGQIEMHARTRFPLVGAHASTSCYRCHPGAEVGYFVPTERSA